MILMFLPRFIHPWWPVTFPDILLNKTVCLWVLVSCNTRFFDKRANPWHDQLTAASVLLPFLHFWMGRFDLRSKWYLDKRHYLLCNLLWLCRIETPHLPCDFPGFVHVHHFFILPFFHSPVLSAPLLSLFWIPDLHALGVVTYFNI